MKSLKKNKMIQMKKNHAKTENTQGVWILYGIVLSLNFLIANEGTTAAKTQ